MARGRINPGLRNAADRMIEGDLAGAKRALSHFPVFYLRQLLDQQGRFTPFALQDMLTYPLDHKLKKILTAALDTDLITRDGLGEFKSIASALHLVDPEGRLTKFGKIRAVEPLPLEKQCIQLSLPLDRIEIEGSSKRIEDDALAHFQQAGATGVAYEGRPFLLLLQGIWFDLLLDVVGDRLGRPARMTAYLEGIVVEEGRSDRVAAKTKARLIAALTKQSNRRIASNLRRLQEDNDQFRVDCPNLTVESLVQLRSALTDLQLRELAEFFLEDPYAHRSGWPDLILVHEEKVKFVEIKAKRDKLHASQIRALPRIHSIVPATSVALVQRN